MQNLPYSYEYLNTVDGTVSPSFLHIRNTGIARFFKRYLIQEAISVFDWTLPKNWDADYFRYILMGWGFISVLKTDLFGVIPQQATLSGYNVFYRPTTAIVANPLLRSRTLKIGKDCSIIKLMPDYGSIADLVDNYGNLMALAYETASINILNSKLSFAFNADTKAEADTYKAMYDAIASGNPAVVYRNSKKSTSLTGENARWQTFVQNVGQNYIAPEVMETIRQIRDEFLTEIGIPNLATRKKERTNLAEVDKNTFETEAKSLLWLETLQEGIETTINLFPELTGELSVKLRYKGDENNGQNVRNRLT